MKIRIFLFLFFIFFNNHGFAEDLVSKAKRVCSAFVEKPQDFKELKKTSCQIKVFPKENLRSAKCFEHIVEGRMRMFATDYYGGGTCQSINVTRVSEDNGQVLEYGNGVINADVNGYGFGGHDIPLEYKGELFLSDDYGDLRVVRADDEVVLCQFCTKFVKWNSNSHNPICKKLKNEEFSSKTVSFPKNNRLHWGGYGSPEEYIDADLDRNGKYERYVRYHYDSGAGCGCGQDTWLSLLMSPLAVSPARPLNSTNSNLEMLSRQLQDITGDCRRGGNHWSIVTIDNKDYLLDASVPNKFGQISSKSYRHLYEYQNGKFSKVCEQVPVTRRVEDRNCGDWEEREWARTYKPLY